MFPRKQLKTGLLLHTKLVTGPEKAMFDQQKLELSLRKAITLGVIS